MNQLLSDSLFPPKKRTDNQDDSDNDSLEKPKDPLASKVWRMYTKAKDSLPHGARMENLTWRMMAMTLTKQNKKAIPETHDEDLMDIDEQPDHNTKHPTTPPVADDTTGLLSSSAPPYTMLDFFKGADGNLEEQQVHPYQQQQMLYDNNKNNVMVFGSTRAINTSDVPNFTVIIYIILINMSLIHTFV